MNRLLLWIFLISFISCNVPTNSLETDLQQSGSNREELEKVIKHYSNIKINEDHSTSLFLSQKKTIENRHLQAALFLIKNMPLHFGYQGSLLSNYITGMDSLFPQMPNDLKQCVYNIPLRNSYFLSQLTKAMDSENLSAEFLIQHIDNAIYMWHTCPWLKNITFHDFCEYILPYRLANEPLIDSKGNTIDVSYKSPILFKKNDTLWWQYLCNTTSIYQNFTPSFDELRSFQRSKIKNAHDKYLINLPTPILDNKEYTFDCLDLCYYNVSLMRSGGIPCAIDYIPEWPTRNGRHYWRVIIDPACKNKNFSDIKHPKAAKIFRQTYSHQDNPSPKKGEYVPDLFRLPFNKDVTAEYINVSDVSINFYFGSNKKPEYVYLAIFNELEWKPIAWSKRKGKTAIFKDLGRGIVYLPVYYQNKELRFGGWPFLLDIDGDIQPLEPNKNNLSSARLTRKYPLSYAKTQWGRDLFGSHVEASNDSLFQSLDTICILPASNPDLNYIQIDFPESCSKRYWRVSQPGRRIILGDLQFINEYGQISNGRVISKGFNKDISALKAFDDDVLTYSNTLSWIGLDLESPTKIKSIRYISRTDDNGIIPGMNTTYTDNQCVACSVLLIVVLFSVISFF